jgi:hypothetical protein
MSINGVGEVARTWAELLQILTMRPDLQEFTVRPWADGLPLWGLLRQFPRWCPLCYNEWRDQHQAVYQPLFWALQVVTACLRYGCPLMDLCPVCQKPQSTLSPKRMIGCCTQCDTWLGSDAETTAPCGTDLLNWQQWVMESVEELYLASMTFGSLPWHRLSNGLDACITSVGGTRQLGRIAGVPNMLFVAGGTESLCRH